MLCAVSGAFVLQATLPALADCTCRALGRDFDLGRSVCLQTPNGPRLAVCAMVLNNTSWRFSEMPCVTARANPATDFAHGASPRPDGG